MYIAFESGPTTLPSTGADFFLVDFAAKNAEAQFGPAAIEQLHHFCDRVTPSPANSRTQIFIKIFLKEEFGDMVRFLLNLVNYARKQDLARTRDPSQQQKLGFYLEDAAFDPQEVGLVSNKFFPASRLPGSPVEVRFFVYNNEVRLAALKLFEVEQGYVWDMRTGFEGGSFSAATIFRGERLLTDGYMISVTRAMHLFPDKDPRYSRISMQFFKDVFGVFGCISQAGLHARSSCRDSWRLVHHSSSASNG